MSEPPESEDVPVLLRIDDQGVYVSNAPIGQGDAIVSRLLGQAGASQHRAYRVAMGEVFGATAATAATAALSGDYYRLTPEAAELLRRFGPETSNGVLRTIVRGDAGRIAGQLTLQPVSLAAEQALALQSAALTIALRSAIKNVERAVEQVSRKVDQIARRLKSEQLGTVVGTHRFISDVVTRSLRRGHLLDADWQSVAGSGPVLVAALEVLRDYTRRSCNELSSELSVGKRSQVLSDLASELPEVLDLILVAEDALHRYEYLRIERVRQHEPDHLLSAMEDAERSLKQQHSLDQQLVDHALELLHATRRIGPMEVHHVIAKRSLDRHAHALHHALQSFAESARATPVVGLAPMPEAQLKDTRQEVRRRAGVAGSAVKELGTSTGQTGARILSEGGSKVRDRVPSMSRAPKSKRPR